MSREFVKAQSYNLPLVTGEMVAHYFLTSEHCNVPETRGVKEGRLQLRVEVCLGVPYSDDLFGKRKIEVPLNVSLPKDPV